MKHQTHFLGIGGIGMSALAHILLDKGEKVSGIDQKESAVIQTLREKGAQIHIQEDFIVDSSIPVVYSSAISASHPSLRQAKVSLHRSQFLAKLMKDQKPLLVTGTHGKTSTSGLLAWTLLHANYDPSYAIGGILIGENKNGAYGKGEYFVAEADESDGSMLNYPGYGAIITNLEKEHLDYWKTIEKLHYGIQTFASDIKSHEHLFWCADDPELISLKLPGKTYGYTKEATYRLVNVRAEDFCLFFTIDHRGHFYEEIKLPLLGSHQALNAVAVWALASELGIAEENIRNAFSSFGGIKRRLEKKGEINGAIFYDDYAHHPTEIKAILAALKNVIGTRRLVAVFEPHRYSRIADLMDDFAAAFNLADNVILTDIYAAGENPIPGITSVHLFDKISKPGAYVPKAELSSHLKKIMKKEDVFVSIGAGDITQLFESVK